MARTATTGEEHELHPRGRARLTLREIRDLNFESKDGKPASKKWLWVFDSNRSDDLGNARTVEIRTNTSFGNENASLTKFINALTNHALTEEQVKAGFDFDKFIGWTIDCTVIWFNPTYGGKTYEDKEMIANVVRVKDPKNTPFVEDAADLGDYPFADE